MSSFTEPLTVTKIGSRRWKVERAFRYYVGSENSNVFIEVPQGTTTDFASVPQPFWILFPPDGKYTQAAVVHDLLYGCGGEVLRFYPQYENLSKEEMRKLCDDIFLEAMTVLEVPKWVRKTMYHAVRMFGRFVF